MPYVVGRLTGYRTNNFGFVGYGPHQMLAAIEHGIVFTLVKCRPRLVVYQAIPDHAWRAAGKAPWDSHGPHYEVTNEGLKYVGHFDDERARSAASRLRRYPRHSSLYRRFIETRVTTGDIRRFAETVAAARDKLGQLYPSASFLVIMWDPAASKKLAMLEADSLTARHIKTVLISDILPGYGDASMQAGFVVSANDQHPTATAHRLIAEYVAGELIH